MYTNLFLYPFADQIPLPGMVASSLDALHGCGVLGSSCLRQRSSLHHPRSGEPGSHQNHLGGPISQGHAASGTAAAEQRSSSSREGRKAERAGVAPARDHHRGLGAKSKSDGEMVQNAKKTKRRGETNGEGCFNGER